MTLNQRDMLGATEGDGYVIALKFQSADSTLTEEEIDVVLNACDFYKIDPYQTNSKLLGKIVYQYFIMFY